MIVQSRTITEQLAQHQARLDLAAATVIAGDGRTTPAPPALPLKPSGAFPPSVWHSSLPPTGLPDLEHWTKEGLSEANQKRIENVISVYSLGFYQLIRAIRAGMSAPSSTVANVWKLFIFLLNDCMPDGSVYSMRIASMERSQSERTRELIAFREAELARLLQMEQSLQHTVRELDRALRRIQTHRQEAEDARLEALDQIDEQEALQLSAAEQISDLNVQAQKWRSRFHLALNRQRLLQEDTRQQERRQNDTCAKLVRTTNDYAAAEVRELRVRDEFEALSIALASGQDRQRKLNFRSAELTSAGARAQAEGQDYQTKLIAIGGRIGQLTICALGKVKERMLIVKQVERIQKELSAVVAMEISASSEVSTLAGERIGITEEISTLATERERLTTDVSTIQTELARLRSALDQKQDAISSERQKLSELTSKEERHRRTKIRMEASLESLVKQLATDESNIAMAEKKLASAMAAVQALTDIVRNTKQENKSLAKEIRVLESHRLQLTQSISGHTWNIDQHESIVAGRIAALKSDIEEYERQIVHAAEQTKRHQAEMVVIKQEQLDHHAQTLQSEMEIEKIQLQASTHATHARSVQAMAKESADALEKLRTQVEEVKAERSAGKVALDALQSEQDAQMNVLLDELKKVEDRAKDSQHQTALIQQMMSTLASERRGGESQHEMDIVEMHQKMKTIEVDAQEMAQNHVDWLETEQLAQKDMQLRLKALNTQILAEHVSTSTFNAQLNLAKEKRDAEIERVKVTEEKLAKEREENETQTAFVEELTQKLAQAENLLTNKVYDNLSIHHLLEYTTAVNADLELRERQHANTQRHRSSTAERDVQTEQEWNPAAS